MRNALSGWVRCGTPACGTSAPADASPDTDPAAPGPCGSGQTVVDHGARVSRAGTVKDIEGKELLEGLEEAHPDLTDGLPAEQGDIDLPPAGAKARAARGAGPSVHQRLRGKAERKRAGDALTALRRRRGWTRLVLGLVVGLAALLIVPGCSSSSSESRVGDPCTQESDCGPNEDCVFPIADGCSAKSTCQASSCSSAEFCCGSFTQQCGCSGQKVDTGCSVAEGYASAPVSPSPSLCENGGS